MSRHLPFPITIFTPHPGGVSSSRGLILFQKAGHADNAKYTRLWLIYIGSCFGQPSVLFMPPTAYVHCLVNKVQKKVKGSGNYDIKRVYFGNVFTANIGADIGPQIWGGGDCWGP